MEEQVRSLMDYWNTHQGYLKESAENDLEFHYESRDEQKKEKKRQIIDALAFWNFINKFMGKSAGWEIRRSFLSCFIAHSNPMIRVVAVAESLPTSVWRKILWKHNIDFMSFESFLRRLEEKQIEAIKQNYEDLFESEEVPRVFSRIERFFKRITVKKLLKEDFNSDKRYSRKAAMSYNLLNLDFGFNAYPKGVRCDTKVEEISPLKFLSVKNHADDFVVNQEDGKYWRLYCKVRSNYVWRPNREVKIKTHICPGFWYTLLMHLVFWILSPLAGVVLSGMIARGLSNVNWWFAGPVGAIGLITPAWLILAGLKMLFAIIAKTFTALVNLAITKQADERIREWFERNKGVIENCAGVAVAIIFLVTIAICITLISLALFPFLYLDLGVVGATITIATIFIYIGATMVFYDKYGMTSFEDFPIYLKMPITFVVFCLVYKFLLLYWAMIISGVFSFVFFLEWIAVSAIGYIKTAFLFLMLIISLFGIQKIAMMTAVVGIPILIIAALHLLSEEKQRRFYDALENGHWYGLGAYLFLFSAAPVYWLITYGGAVGAILVFLLASYCIGIGYMFFYSNPYVDDSRWVVQYTPGGIDFRELLKNKWLLSLGRYEAKEKINSLYFTLMQIFDWNEKYCRKVIICVAPFISPETVQRLENHRQSLRKIDDHDLRMMVVGILISRDVDFESAVAMAEKERDAQYNQEISKLNKAEEFKERFNKWAKAAEKVFGIVFFIPIRFFRFVAIISRGARFVIEKLWEYVLTLRRLWELFNERCPYITESKILKFK